MIKQVIAAFFWVALMFVLVVFVRLPGNLVITAWIALMIGIEIGRKAERRAAERAAQYPAPEE
jgi:hypothetical protein